MNNTATRLHLAAMAAALAALATASPVQAESLVDCFQREQIQRLTAQVQRQTSVRQVRVDALTRQIQADLAIAEAAGRYARRESTENVRGLNAMGDLQKKLDQVAIGKHQAGVNVANLQDALMPSSCYP